MPATPGKVIDHWDAPAFITGHTPVENVDNTYHPEDREACVQFVLTECLPHIDVYAGYADLQREEAEKIANSIYNPGTDVVAALHQYLTREELTTVDEEPAQTRTVYIATVTDLRTGEQTARRGTPLSRAINC